MCIYLSDKSYVDMKYITNINTKSSTDYLFHILPDEYSFPHSTIMNVPGIFVETKKSFKIGQLNHPVNDFENSILSLLPSEYGLAEPCSSI